MQKYFKEIEDKVKVCYSVAEAAREKGLDPLNKVEIPLARSLAERVVGLMSVVYPQLNDKRIVDRILELEKQYGQLDPTVSFKIAEEIALEKFCKFEKQLQAIEAGIKLGFAYNTLGVVSSPIEGLTEIKTGKTRDGKDYLRAYFSGPIRSAGTTASCLVLLLIDYLRELFGYAKYDPEINEVKRYITENLDYHERVNNLQYLPSEAEIDFLAKNMPIEVTGEPSEEKEVSNQKNLPRVETNCIRGGMCLCFSEGLAQKAQKGLRLLNMAKKNGIKSTGWDFLQEYVDKFKMHKKKEESEKKDAIPTYMKDIVAGRPIFGHPSRSGSFRFRYGRSRVSGFSAVSIHPATMGISGGFLSIGTQLKIEKPTKGCVVTSCDSIDGPIVKFKNGSVKKINDFEEAKKIYGDIEEIVYFGDVLIPFGDIANRNYDLIKCGYVEEWWESELKNAIGYEIEKKDLVDKYNVKFLEAIEISQKTGIPLHPRFIFYWTQIDKETLIELLYYLMNGVCSDGKIILPYSLSIAEKFFKAKRAMELIGLEHEVTIENIVIKEDNARALLINLGIDFEVINKINYKILNEVSETIKKVEINLGSILEIINSLSKFKIKDKAGTFIGSRMGRPEKAKLRKLTGSPSVLFPVGEEGGRFRSINVAVEVGNVKSDFPIYKCLKCNKETIYRTCEDCGEGTTRLNYCKECHQVFESKICPEHKIGQKYFNRKIDIKHYLQRATHQLGFENSEVPILIKGVKGTSNEDHTPENLAKGLLRSKRGLCVNKDGTIRYDATETPITHFRPLEIEVGVEKLKELGYMSDIFGRPLENSEQVLELKPHDILLSACPDSLDERGDDVFIKIANFVDDLLVKFYHLKPFYNIKRREDLVGHLVACMAPHNCAGVIGRIVGFSKSQTFFASPYIHAAMRRDCVYPETDFIYSDKGILKKEKIGEYVENLLKQGQRTKALDSFGTIGIESDKEIYALGIDPETKKLKKKKIKYFIKAKTPEYWIKVKTSTGREQTMTPRHKFIYLDDKDNFKVKQASEIKVGDRIALLKNFNLEQENLSKIYLPFYLAQNMPLEKLKEIRICNSKHFFMNLAKKIGIKKIREILNLDEEFNNFLDWYNIVPLSHIKILVEKGFFRWEDIPQDAKIRTNNNNLEWNLYLQLTGDLMSLLGFYSSEGYSRQTKTVSQVCFRIIEKSQKEKLIKSIKTCFNIRPSLDEEETKISICNKLVYYLFEYCFKCGKNAYEKRVPEIVLNASKNLIIYYLSAYFDGDGTIVYQNEFKKYKKMIAFYSVNRKLLDDIALLCCKFGLLGRYSKTGLRPPGKKVLERYAELGKTPKKHILYHLVYSGKDFYELSRILKSSSELKRSKIERIDYSLFNKEKIRKAKFEGKELLLMDKGDIFIDFVSEISKFVDNKNAYCFEIDWKNEEDKNVLWGEQIINARCDGDEAAVMLLLDTLLNFSRSFLPSHRGGTQDAPLVLNARIRAGEVDDQILDHELVFEYPLELYQLSEAGGHHSSEIKIEMVKQRLSKGEEVFVGSGYTHETKDFNKTITNSSYKTIPNMMQKVEEEMTLIKKIRAVDNSDVARLIIDRHFIRDLRGNLRKFSQQQFRCVTCNMKFRRPPLSGKCLKCGGKIIFTISYGSIVKYLEPALKLAEEYNVSPYIKQSLILAKKYIESIFGRETEKQESMSKWMG